MNRRDLVAFIILAIIGVAASPVVCQVGGGAIAAIDEPAEAVGGGSSGKTAVTRTRSPSANTRIRTSSPSKGVPSASRPRPWTGPVIGDKYLFLNFEVLSAEKPYHTRAAKAAGASGLVQVEILIDTNGSVIAARARTGNKLLHAEAERAALASKFTRPTHDGRPARAIGFLVYRFGPAEE